MIRNLFLFSILLLGLSSVVAQQENSYIKSMDIVVTNADVSSDVVLGEITTELSTAGKVIVTFNGSCIADGGANILVAASNTPAWVSNEGHVSLQIHNNNQDARSFSHTMVYDVEAGSNTFYAVGRRWAGTGLASFYGALTVEFIPSDNIIVETAPVAVSNLAITAGQDMADLTINATTAGKVELSFSGYCYSEIGATIGLSGSDISSTLDDNFYQDIYTDGDVPSNQFSQKLVFDVDPGTHTFYAVADIISGNDGNISCYGNLVAKFIPMDNDFSIDAKGILGIYDVADVTVVDSLETSVAQDGIYIINFSGDCYSSYGDRIILAASNTHSWSTNNGNISVEAVSDDYNSNNFSHTMAYAVTPGNYTYYAVGQAFVETGGDQTIDLYATLSAVFYPNIITGINTNNDKVNLSLFPNPMQNQLTISGIDNEATVSVFSVDGKLILSSTINNNEAIDVASLSKGTYLVTVSNNGNRFSQKIIKE